MSAPIVTWLILASLTVILLAAVMVIVACCRGRFDGLEDVKYVVLNGHEEDFWADHGRDAVDPKRKTQDREKDVIL